MKIKIGQVNFFVIIIFALFNCVSLFISNKPITDYLLYVLPFIVVGLLYFFLENKKKYFKINALLFAIFGLFTTLVSDQGNTHGAIFICFSVYIYNSTRSNIILLALTLISIVGKHLIMEITAMQILNILIFYSYILIIYYILIHPKKPELLTNPKIDDETRKVLQYLTLGYKIKEIAKLGNIYLSEDAIRQRLLRTRKEFMCTTNVQLTYELFKLGYFKHKSD